MVASHVGDARHRVVPGVDRTQRATWSRAVVALAAPLLAGVGCDASNKAPAPPVSAVSPASRATGGSSAPRGRVGDRTTLVGAYRRFWAVASTVDSQPEPGWRALLAAVTAEPLLSRLVSGLEAQAASGSRQYGAVVTHPTVVHVDADRASIVDCQDASRSGLLDTATGLPSTVGSPRTPVAATLLRDPNGVWRVSDARYLDGGC